MSQVVVVFDQALQVEGLVELLTDERLDLALDDPSRPILLAVSDNGPPMVSTDTRAFMAAVAIAQHHGRPSTPTDQAWIESFFGHIKTEWPHLCDIAEANLLKTELRRIRSEYNNVRLHEARLRHTNVETTIKDKPSATPAAKDYNKPAKPGSTTTAEPISTTPKKPNDRFDSTPQLRGRLTHLSSSDWVGLPR